MHCPGLQTRGIFCADCTVTKDSITVGGLFCENPISKGAEITLIQPLKPTEPPFTVIASEAFLPATIHANVTLKFKSNVTA